MQPTLPLSSNKKHTARKLLCDEFEEKVVGGKKSCKYYMENGSCSKSHLLMCINYLVHKEGVGWVNRIKNSHYVFVGDVVDA